MLVCQLKTPIMTTKPKAAAKTMNPNNNMIISSPSSGCLGIIFQRDLPGPYLSLLPFRQDTRLPLELCEGLASPLRLLSEELFG